MINLVKKYELTGKLRASRNGELIIEADGIFHDVYEELFEADLIDGDMTKRPYNARLTIEFKVDDIK